MLRPLFLTRASIGLAATAAERVVALPDRAVEAVTTLPTIPVRVAGGLVRSYLHAGQSLTDLAVKGDKVLASVFPARSDQPGWATFDEDEDEAEAEADPDVPTGRVAPRDA